MIGYILIFLTVVIYGLTRRKELVTAKLYQLKKIVYVKLSKRHKMLHKINNLRSYFPNAKELVAGETITRLAHIRCLEMLNSGVISHSSAQDEFEELVQLGAGKVGENIAFGYVSVDSAFKAWCNSEAHFNNMISKEWDFVGIGIEKNIYVILFGKL